VKLIQEVLLSNKILISIPPYLRDFSFIKIFADQFNENEIQFYGDWPEEIKMFIFQNFKLASTAKVDLSKIKVGVFTSGTLSGKPRLVLYTLDNIKSSVNSIRSLFQTDRIEQIFCYPQPLHTFGLNLGYFQSVFSGTSLQFLEGAYSQAAHKLWYDSLTENTLTLGTPTHFLDLISWVRKNNLTPKKSYSCIIGGAHVSRKLWHEIQTVLNIESPSIGYGATEASPGVTHLNPGLPPLEDGDIGYQLSSISNLRLSSDGLEFSGPALCHAIFENDKIQFPKSLLLKDNIQSIHSNRFQFCGRLDLIINRGGTKVSLEAIESKLFELTGFKILALGLADQRLGETLGLIIETNEPQIESQFEFVEKESSETTKLFNQVNRYLIDFFGIRLNPEHFVTHQIPLNNSFKFDRREGRRILLKQLYLKFPIKFPISISEIKDFMPHRDSAIWIDQLIETQFRFGKSLVHIKARANYMSQEGLRPSSAIEFVAQTYGYAVVANDLLGIQKADTASQTYIAEINNVVFNENLFKQVKDQDQLFIESRCTHDFGPLKVITGTVKNNKEQCLATVGLKVFVTE
jgi:hypothetical protein